MSEIEKMYELVQPEKRCNTYGTFGQCPHKTWKCEECTSFVYRPFTAEKQIELIKLLAKNDNIYITFYPSDNAYNIRYCATGFYDGSIMGDKEVMNVDFKKALAGIINTIWQDLIEEEKQQVKGILE